MCDFDRQDAKIRQKIRNKKITTLNTLVQNTKYNVSSKKSIPAIY